MVLAIVLILVLGGGGIKTGDGEIVNADAFLTDATQQWRSTLPTEGVEVHEDASCFYVVGKDGEVTGKIACGGVRRYDTADGVVWDVASFNTSVEATDEVTASGLAFAEFSVRRPADELRDAEGNQADKDLDKVKAPALPQAPAGLVIADSESFTATTRTDEINPGPDNAVRVPGGLVEFTSIATLDAVSTEDGLYAPADGDTFRLVEFTYDTLDTLDDTDATTKIVLDSNGTKADVIEDTTDAESGTFLVSATDGAALVVTTDGHEQRIDPFTGERDDDPVAETFYRDGTEQDINKSLHWPNKSGTFKDEEYQLTHEAAVTTVALTPYLSEHLDAGTAGWAPEGSAWLILAVETGAAQAQCCYIDADKTIQSWVASIDGKTYKPSKPLTLDSGWMSFGESLYVAIEVPATTTTAEIAVTANTVIEHYEGATQTIPNGTQTFNVEFQ